MPQPGEPFNPYQMFDGVFLPNWLIRSAINPGAKILYGRMTRYAAKTGRCNPRQETLAAAMGGLSTRVIRKYLTELQDAGLVQSTQRGLQRSNEYTFLWHAWMDEELCENNPGWEPPDRNERAAPEWAERSAPFLIMSNRTSTNGPRGARSTGEAEKPQRKPRGIKARADDNDAALDESLHPAFGRRSPQPKLRSGAGLAQQFRLKTSKAFPTPGPQPYSPKRFGEHMLAWQQEGIPAEVIVVMIDLFCRSKAPPGLPLWRGFLADRQKLYEKARTIVRDQLPDEERYVSMEPRPSDEFSFWS